MRTENILVNLLAGERPGETRAQAECDVKILILAYMAASTGSALAQELRQTGRYPTRLISVEQDKIGRLYVQQAKFEAGFVLFPKGAAFLPVLKTELLAFPQAKTDDRVDSISQALAYKFSGYDSTFSWV